MNKNLQLIYYRLCTDSNSLQENKKAGSLNFISYHFSHIGSTGLSIDLTQSH